MSIKRFYFTQTPKKVIDKPAAIPQQFVYPVPFTMPYQQSQPQPQHRLQQQQQQQQQSPQPQQQPQQHYTTYPGGYYVPTMPNNIPFQGGYFAPTVQSPIYYGESGQAIIMSPQHWNMPQSMYLSCC